MSNPVISRSSWDELFAFDPGTDSKVLVQMHELWKRNNPFLLLPEESELARVALGLYAGHSRKGRFAKNILAMALSTGFHLPLRHALLSVNPAKPFVRFLGRLANMTERVIPRFAVYAGNPMTLGRRFLTVPFKADGTPAAVVKAGVDMDAQSLIEKEMAFLSAMPPGKLGCPSLRGTFSGVNVRAFAMAFVSGSSAPEQAPRNLSLLLNSWLNLRQHMRVAELPIWQRLEACCGDNPIFRSLATRLGSRLIHPCLYHGDFTPWNVKVSPRTGEWTVLDWERGDLHGIPGWDWLHYTVQPWILVHRRPSIWMAKQLENILKSDPFRTYAAHAGVLGVERELALAYTLHNTQTIPTEQKHALQRLLTVLTKRWLHRS